MTTATKKWIALDAAGTLFDTAEPVENIYADCFSMHGFGIPESTWKKAFVKAFNLTPDPIYEESADGDAVEREWWQDLVRRAAEATGTRPDPETMTEAFDELFEHYSVGSAWKLFPETEAVLTSLKSKGCGLVITSNFDSRIHRVIEELGIAHHFDMILTSSMVRARKPSPLVLEMMMSESGAELADCCLAGDSLSADKGAAEAAGILFYHIDRPHSDLNSFEKWHEQRFFSK